SVRRVSVAIWRRLWLRLFFMVRSLSRRAYLQLQQLLPRTLMLMLSVNPTAPPGPPPPSSWAAPPTTWFTSSDRSVRRVSAVILRRFWSFLLFMVFSFLALLAATRSNRRAAALLADLPPLGARGAAIDADRRKHLADRRTRCRRIGGPGSDHGKRDSSASRWANAANAIVSIFALSAPNARTAT